MYKARANHKDRCAIIAEKWDISPSTVWKYHESPSIIKEDPTGSQHPVTRRAKFSNMGMNNKKEQGN